MEVKILIQVSHSLLFDQDSPELLTSVAIQLISPIYQKSFERIRYINYGYWNNVETCLTKLDFKYSSLTTFNNTA